MALELDNEIKQVLASLTAGAGGVKPPATGDWQTRRKNATDVMVKMAEGHVLRTDISRTSYSTIAVDGGEVALFWYALDGSQPGSALLFIHGGGMIFGSVELYEPIIERYVAETGVPILAVDYRLAPEHPDPVPVEDCYASLQWLADNATTLGVDAERIAVLGESAGGGLAAGISLLSHDRGGPKIAQQVLIAPMLDDATSFDANIAPFAFWTYDDNLTGWGALLGDKMGSADVSAYAVPARRADLSGLPPAYIDVGELDIFRDEDARYALALAGAGVSVEFHLHRGAPHGFASVAPKTAIALRALADRVRCIKAV